MHRLEQDSHGYPGEEDIARLLCDLDPDLFDGKTWEEAKSETRVRLLGHARAILALFPGKPDPTPEVQPDVQ